MRPINGTKIVGRKEADIIKKQNTLYSAIITKSHYIYYGGERI